MHVPRARHRTVAVAVVALLVAAAFGAPAAVAAWRSPVPGAAVTRGFDLGSNPFEAGSHRGIDLDAPAGAVVRAPCAGRVVVAGRVGTSGGVVTIRCGPWRVSHLPLGTIGVRRGEVVVRGRRLGTAARAREHRGLHLGVRREGVRFGYVDPLRFLATDHRPPVLGPAPRAARPSRHVIRAPRPPKRHGIRAPRPPATAPARVAGSNPGHARGPAPWPAWAGLALILAGAGVRWGGAARRRARPAGVLVPEEVP